MDRRGFLGAILAAGVAPAIVRVESLMVIKARPIAVPITIYFENRIWTYTDCTRLLMSALNTPDRDWFTLVAKSNA